MIPILWVTSLLCVLAVWCCGPDNEKPPTEVDGRGRTPVAGVRYEMTMTG
ncbi:MAG: hypothetical protein WEE69_07885 [Acidimicrobiia bacterium]